MFIFPKVSMFTTLTSGIFVVFVVVIILDWWIFEELLQTYFFEVQTLYPKLMDVLILRQIIVVKHSEGRWSFFE